MLLHYRHKIVSSVTEITAINNLNKKTQKFWGRGKAHIFLLLILELQLITGVF